MAISRTRRPARSASRFWTAAKTSVNPSSQSCHRLLVAVSPMKPPAPAEDEIPHARQFGVSGAGDGEFEELGDRLRGAGGFAVSNCAAHLGHVRFELYDVFVGELGDRTFDAPPKRMN